MVQLFKPFQFLIEKWQKGEYNAFNQLISLSKNGASVTLEPGCQLELSGKILKNVHLTCTETYEYMNFRICKTKQPLSD